MLFEVKEACVAVSLRVPVTVTVYVRASDGVLVKTVTVPVAESIENIEVVDGLVVTE